MVKEAAGGGIARRDIADGDPRFDQLFEARGGRTKGHRLDGRQARLRAAQLQALRCGSENHHHREPGVTAPATPELPGHADMAAKAGLPSPASVSSHLPPPGLRQAGPARSPCSGATRAKFSAPAAKRKSTRTANL